MKSFILKPEKKIIQINNLIQTVEKSKIKNMIICYQSWSRLKTGLSRINQEKTFGRNSLKCFKRDTK